MLTDFDATLTYMSQEYTALFVILHAELERTKGEDRLLVERTMRICRARIKDGAA